MLMHAMAPGKVVAPELFAKWSYVRELGLDWDNLGGINLEDISLLAKMINIHYETTAMKARVAAAGGKRGGRS